MSAPDDNTTERAAQRIGTQDAAAGLFLCLVGGAIAIGATDLNLGTPVRMGPGFMPLTVGLLLCVIGAVLLLGALRGGAKLPAFPTFRPLLALTGGFAAFAGLIGPLGLLAAAFAGVAIASFGTRPVRLVQKLIFAAVISGLAALLFVGLLDLPLRLWPAP